MSWKEIEPCQISDEEQQRNAFGHVFNRPRTASLAFAPGPESAQRTRTGRTWRSNTSWWTRKSKWRLTHNEWANRRQVELTNTARWEQHLCSKQHNIVREWSHMQKADHRSRPPCDSIRTEHRASVWPQCLHWRSCPSCAAKTAAVPWVHRPRRWAAEWPRSRI